MKYCPSCQITYADETLRFCLQDGTGLLDYPGTVPLPTVDWSEKETVVRQTPVTSGWEEKNRSTQDAAIQPAVKKYNTPLTVILTALVMCIIFGGIGFGWLLFGGKSSENKNLSNTSGSNTIKTPSQTPPAANKDERSNKTDSTPDSLAGWQPTDYNASLNGERLTYYQGTTVEACRADCEVNAKCAGFGLVRAGYYNPSDPPMCYLLSKVTSSTPSTCCISAIKK
ncbi:MAG TPA: hypothetical protein VNB22_09685 [Pyrinomonadaceae bacterium]|nr:hypothetical protein [Pyrinomonadaceae bacterium]